MKLLPTELYNNQPLAEADSIDCSPQIDWTKPESFGDPPTLFEQGQRDLPELTPEFLPAWVSDFVKALTAEAQTPPALATLLVLPILAACMQKRFEVYPKEGSYTEPLSIWSLVALPPASRKTAVLQSLLTPVNEWEATRLKTLQHEIDEIETAVSVSKGRISELERKAAKEDDREKRRKLLQEINEIKGNIPAQVFPPKVYSTDTTPEALRNTLAEQGERGAVISDEAGIFEVLGGLYSDGKCNLDVFLQGHAGGPLRVARAGRQVYLNKIALSLGLAVQPIVIEELSRKDRKSFRGKGLIARFLFAVPNSNIGKRDVRKHAPIPPAIKEKYAAMIRNLLDIPPKLDDNGKEVPRYLKLDKQAREAHEDFSQWVEDRQGSGRQFERIQDWTGKLPGAALRIAGLSHVACICERESCSTFSTSSQEEISTIPAECMLPVIEFCKKLIPHTQAAFDAMGEDPVITDARFALEWILGNAHKDEHGASFFKQSSLHTSSRFKNSRAKRVECALEVLHERRIISNCVKLSTRKPTRIFYINPLARIAQPENI